MSIAEIATSAARTNCKKLMKFGLSIFRRGFNSSKCKTMAKMAVARIKLLRNKRQVVVKQMRRDVALLLQSGQDATARIRVEHVIREQNIMAANEFIELFCELVVARLSIIAKRRECLADLKEGVSSLIFAAPRCNDIPELLAIRDIFEKKYGKDFVSAATDLRPSCGVNRMLIDKLSVRTPSGEVKLKVLKEIAKEYQIEWDTTESEMELLKPPEELTEGPDTFISASSIPMKPEAMQTVEPNKLITRSTGESDTMHFENTASAAEAAAESAKKAIAAAYLANIGSNQVTQAHGFHSNLNASSINHGFGGNISGNSTGHFIFGLGSKATMPSSEKHPSHVPMWRGVKFAYLLIAMCLFPLAIGGYWAYGHLIPSGGMLTALYQFHSRDVSRFVLGLTSLFVIVNAVSSFQIYGMPMFDGMESQYTIRKKQACPWWLRSLFRAMFGYICFFIAVVIPFLPSLAGLIGGIALPGTLAYPCFMWLKIKKPKIYSAMWWVNWGLGVFGMALSGIFVAAGIYVIIDTGVEVSFFHPH